MKKKAINKKMWVIVGSVVVLLAVLGVNGYMVSRGSNAGREENMLELGQRYLDELNYEQAIVCFEEYLKIDPMSVEAYLGLAETYERLGDLDKAREILIAGLEITGDGRLQEKLGDYVSGLQLIRPQGEVIIPFSPEASVYFITMDYYKRHYGMVISAPEGTAVIACASGKVIDIYDEKEHGTCITMDLGNGYEITYGQLKDVQVAQGSYINAGETIAVISYPSKFFMREGSNLYLELTANGTPVNPEELFY